ncbi:hypothetical protein EYF80_007736 [Liparis tanakae]|uniref:Uncharacterized protein n=1 Tax=Liparis tanakae TaxID=230148 RepID=A0A4Z2IVW1_9TELE|nr:hypothetical protein EYF80_007736 [Liparis tanakae]
MDTPPVERVSLMCRVDGGPTLRVDCRLEANQKICLSPPSVGHSRRETSQGYDGVGGPVRQMCVSVTDVFRLSGLRRGHRHLEKEHKASEKTRMGGGEESGVRRGSAVLMGVMGVGGPHGGKANVTGQAGDAKSRQMTSGGAHTGTARTNNPPIKSQSLLSPRPRSRQRQMMVMESGSKSLFISQKLCSCVYLAMIPIPRVLN